MIKNILPEMVKFVNIRLTVILSIFQNIQSIIKSFYNFFFIRKSQQRIIIKGLSFFVVAGFTAMYVYMKVSATC